MGTGQAVETGETQTKEIKTAMVVRYQGENVKKKMIVEDIPLSKIRRNPKQPRKTFNEDSLNELAQTIRAVGVLQPVKVIRKAKTYTLIMGERRFRAAKLAGLKEIPAIIVDDNGHTLLKESIIENLGRENLSYLEQGRALQRLMKEEKIISQRGLSRITGLSRTHIRDVFNRVDIDEDPELREVANEVSDSTVTDLTRSTKLRTDRVLLKGVLKRVAEDKLGRTDVRRIGKHLPRVPEETSKKFISGELSVDTLVEISENLDDFQKREEEWEKRRKGMQKKGINTELLEFYDNAEISKDCSHITALSTGLDFKIKQGYFSRLNDWQCKTWVETLKSLESVLGLARKEINKDSQKNKILQKYK